MVANYRIKGIKIMNIPEIKDILRQASVEVDIQGHGKHIALFESDFERVAIELVKKLTLTDVSKRCDICCYVSVNLKGMKTKEDIEYRIKKLEQTLIDNKAFLYKCDDITLQEEDEIYMDNFNIKEQIKMLKWVLN
jgi:trans-2-enoyl-CoA reductase